MTGPLFSAEGIMHALGREAVRGNEFAVSQIARIEAAEDREAEARLVVGEAVLYMEEIAANWDAIEAAFAPFMAAMAERN